MFAENATSQVVLMVIRPEIRNFGRMFFMSRSATVLTRRNIMIDFGKVSKETLGEPVSVLLTDVPGTFEDGEIYPK
jgi:hypothetical protein